ncbi:MAG TPA: dihydrolipoyllysine-residue acetyltransferase [Nevskiaceae bacterium]|nr:dihydrolipoyllysine-residue acetyltransferase [Nevskiaceae bacterium]
MSRLIEIRVPDLGGAENVPIIELLVAVGDTLSAEQELLVLESDKATMPIPAPASGRLARLDVKVGDRLSSGQTIGQIELAAEATAPAPAPPAAAPTTAAPAAPAAPVPNPAPTSAPPPAPAPQSASAGQRQPLTVPDLGGHREVPVIELLVAEGETVRAEQELLVLESDKATMPVPAPAAGVIRGLRLKVGDRVSPGDLIAELEGSGGSAPAAAPAAPAATPAPAVAPAVTAAAASPAAAAAPPAVMAPPARPAAAYAGPASRKLARQLGVAISEVSGSGPRGRITLEDLHAHVRQRLARPAASPAAGSAAAGIPPIPVQDFSQYGPIERRELARIRKLSAAHLHRAWLNVPHVTQFDEADITELERFRKAQGESGGVKLTLLPFVLKAVSVALRQYPEFNSSLAPDGEALILKGYCHLGFAADTPHGLVVPVVRDVWNKGLLQLAQETAELARKAREGKLKPDEMRGGCFSVSSLGGIGGSHFTPIVNAPEVGILGVSKAQMKPVWDGAAFQPRLLCPLSLSYDHRVIDGAYAARFMVLLTQLLGDLRRLLL